MSRLLDALHRARLDPDSLSTLAGVVGIGSTSTETAPVGLETVPAFSAFVLPEGRL